MKTNASFLIAGFILILFSNASQAQSPFITTWQMYAEFPTLTIPTSGGGYSYTVDWGDGTTDNTVYTANATHDYTADGIYSVAISGTFPKLFFKNTLVLSVAQWGDIQWQSMDQAFMGCPYVTITATDAPDLSAVTSLSEMFESDAAIGNADLSGWNVSNVTNMWSMFTQSGFDGNVSTWDVSNVTEMGYMFYQTPFSGDVSSWSTGNVTSMFAMFSDCHSFNSDIGNWDVSNVQYMQSFLMNATSFDQDLGSWDLSAVDGISLYNTNMSPQNYSSTLLGWATLDAGESGIPTSKSLQAAGLKYCDATGRTALENTYFWNMFDDGPAHPEPDVADLSPIISETPVSSPSPPTGTDCTGAAIIGQTTATFPVTTSQFITWTYTNLDALVTEQQQYIFIGKPFVTTWETTTDNESITIPTTGGGYSYVVDWGDGTSYGTPYTGNASHVYAAPGTYSISSAGSFPRIHFYSGGDKDKIRSIEQWGDIGWSDMTDAFRGCVTLNILATDAPDLSAVTTLENMFYGAGVSGDLSGWDVSGVTSLWSTFFESTFDGNISTWDVSNVTTMYGIFAHSPFNGDISAWDVSHVTNMSAMFYRNTAFNQDISNWDVSSAITMEGLFAWAPFNGDVSQWNVSNVVNMKQVFETTPFAGNISAWDVSNVTSMYAMFDHTPFNGDLSAWDVSNVTDMSFMFQYSGLNQSLASWDIGSATNMERMLSLTSQMTSENYESTLTGWASLDAGEVQIPATITLGADGLRYCDVAAHNTLVNDHGWVFSNDIKNCKPTLTSIGDKNAVEDTELAFTIIATDVETTSLDYLLDQASIDKGMLISATGDFTWTPDDPHIGINEVTITISDGDLTDSETIFITVTSVNDAPLITTIGPRSVNDSETLAFVVGIIDPDSPNLVVDLDATSIDKGMTLDVDGNFSWTPTPVQVGPHDVTVSVGDGEFTDTETFTITVVRLNDAPVLSVIGNQVVDEDQALTLTLSADDPDGDGLVFSTDATSAAAGVTVSPAGELSWTPTAADVGGRAVRISVSDGELTDYEDLFITVNWVNDPPVLAAIGNKEVNEDGTLTFMVSATDEETSYALDIDDISFNKGMYVDGTGAFNWTPGENFIGEHEVTITVTDGTSTDSETFTITVVSVNDAPVLSGFPNKTVTEFETLTFMAVATDEENETLTYNLDDPSLAKGMTISSSGEFQWTPTGADEGVHTAIITVSDGVRTDSKSVLISVLHLNVAPELAHIGDYAIATGETLSLTASATDPENDVLTFTVDQPSIDQGMSISSSGVFTWTPNDGQVGLQIATITVSDGVATDFQSFQINVSPANAPKLNAIGDKEVNEDQLLTFTVSATDTDSPTLTYSLDAVSIVKGMMLTPAGQFSWTPDFDMIGEHLVTFTVSDGQFVDLEDITITVNEVNDVPQVTKNMGLSILRGEQGTISSDLLLVTDEETPAEGVVYTITSIPAKGNLLNNAVAVAINDSFSQAVIDANAITYEHNGETGATDSFSFTVSDGDGGEIASTIFSINIQTVTAVETGPDAGVVVYPMPAQDVINISMVNEYRGQVNFRLINASGQSIVIEGVSKESTELNHSINVGHATSGIHFLQIITGGQSHTVAVMKK